MTTIAITTRCRHCGRPVEDAMHVMLCDRCLDARFTQFERTPAVAAGAMRALAMSFRGTRGVFTRPEPVV
jgi:hypothetical protein